MNFSTVQSSEISSESLSFLFGEMVSNPNILSEKESVDIVKMVFGIRSATNPTAIEITEAMVRNLSTVENNNIRSMLQNRAVNGIIWRFTTKKKFMVILEKVPTYDNHHDLSLKLIYVSHDTDFPATYSRELVRFGKNGVTFFNAGMREIDYTVRNYNILVKLHDEAVENLEKKYLEPQQEETVETPSQSVEEPTVTEVIPDSQPEETSTVPKEPSQPEKIFSVDEVVTFIKKNDDGVCEISGSNETVELTDPNFDDNFAYGTYRVKEDISEEIVKFEQLDEFMEYFEFIAAFVHWNGEPYKMTAGSTLNVFKQENGGIQIEISTDLQGITSLLFRKELPPVMCDNIKLGKYKAVNDYSILFVTDEEITALMSNCEFIEDENVEVVAPPEETEPQPETSEQQPSTEETNNMAEIKIVVDPSFKDIEPTLTEIVRQIISENPGANDTLVTSTVKICSEIDEVRVEFKDGVWNVVPEFVQQPPKEPEIPSVDIHDTNVQMTILKSIFGVTDPAITHVEKFLRNHLTEEGNVGYLKTGTFPTETVIIYTQKPYDVTISIVKFKDGRFYRCQLALTDVSLGDADNHGYLVTNDITGRWVRLGRDIQNTAYRQDQRGRRY